MTQEYFIMAAVDVISIASIFYMPKKSYRLALVSLLICQAISWPQPIIFVQIGYTEFPVRDFMRATKVNFSLLYLFFPMVFVWFMLLFPQNASISRKIIHYFMFVSIIVWFDFYIAYYTDLQKILKGTQLFTVSFLYLRGFAYFIVCQLYVKWFSKKTGVLAGGLNA